MITNNTKILCCPICKNKLIKKIKNYICQNGHNFDIAKDGYVNLLLPNKKSSKIPGDSGKIVDARKSFLNKGYYRILSDKVNEVIVNNCKDYINTYITIIDIGCGEGYYLSNFIENENNFEYEAYGIDISKKAVKFAAKRNKDINWLVGNAFDLPFDDNSVDILLCMFTLIDFNECNRVLKKDGKLIIVKTGEEHLLELRKIIYPEISKSRDDNKNNNTTMNLENEINVKYKTKLNENLDIVNLLKMTPHYWKIKERDKKDLFEYKELNITVDVDVEIYSKKCVY